MRTPRPLLALLLVGALALAGCGGEASPKPAPLTKTPTASSTPSSPSPLPSAIRGSSDQAAASYVSYFLKVYSAAAISGNVEELAPLATQDCTTCKGLQKDIEQTYAAGGTIRGEGARVSDLTVKVSTDRKVALVTGVVTIYPQVWTKKKGAAPSRSKGGPAPSEFTLRAVSGQWRIVDWTLT